MTGSSVAYYLTYRKLNHRFLTVVGWSQKHSSLLILLSHIQLYLSLSMAYFIFRHVKTVYTNVALLTRSLSVMSSFLATSLKMLCWITHRKEMAELQEILDNYSYNLLVQRNHLSELMLNKIHVYRWLTLSFCFFVFYSTFSYFIIPLHAIIGHYIHHTEPAHPILIYPTNYPWHVPNFGFIFLLHFILETSANVALFTVSVSTDSLFAYYMFLMTGQLREISYYLTKIDEKTNNYDSIARKCITRYTLLMKCRDNLQKIYGPIVLAMVASNAVILCTLIYQVTQLKSISLLRGMLFVAYSLLKIVQTFMYAWSGTDLITESEEYRISIYMANWLGNKRFMTDALFMLQQKPFTLSACSFSVVSLNIFTKIMNTTVSYFFLLKTME